RSESLVPRRLSERTAWSHGLCPPIRAHALPGLGKCRRERAFRVGSESGWNIEWLDVAGSNQLLRDSSVESTRTRVMARGGSNGPTATGDDAAEARYAAG